MKQFLAIVAVMVSMDAARPDEPTAREITEAKARSIENLKRLGTAMHDYYDTHRRFPNNVADAKGNLLLSWRVLLLPYLEEDALFKQFKLDEAWDGPKNKALIEKMPALFDIPLAKGASLQGDAGLGRLLGLGHGADSNGA